MADEIDYQDYQKALQFDQRISGMGALQSLTRVLIEELDPQETDTVLDVGTGTGRLGVVLCDTVPKGFVTGIDSGRRSANLPPCLSVRLAWNFSGRCAVNRRIDICIS